MLTRVDATKVRYSHVLMFIHHLHLSSHWNRGLKTKWQYELWMTNHHQPAFHQSLRWVRMNMICPRWMTFSKLESWMMANSPNWNVRIDRVSEYQLRKIVDCLCSPKSDLCLMVCCHMASSRTRLSWAQDKCSTSIMLQGKRSHKHRIYNWQLSELFHSEVQ